MQCSTMAVHKTFGFKLCDLLSAAFKRYRPRQNSTVYAVYVIYYTVTIMNEIIVVFAFHSKTPDKCNAVPGLETTGKSAGR